MQGKSKRFKVTNLDEKLLKGGFIFSVNEIKLSH